MRVLFFFTATILVVLVHSTRAETSGGPVRHTQYGPVQGVVHDNVTSFLGIPFAAPPTGANRFKEPLPPTKWNSTYDASFPRSPCPNMLLDKKLVFGNEDCLYLNVWTPHNSSFTVGDVQDALLPVMVWIYGGAFEIGDGVEFGLYNGVKLAQRNDVVVVTVNYRLSAFGFLALEQLAAESADGSTGNLGILDQRFAMQWVQANIKAFGGDPSRVTVFGESAGAISTCVHLASPGSQGLFSAAMMESGMCDGGSFETREHAIEFGNTFATAAGCNTTELSRDQVLPCLRALSTVQLMTNISDYTNPSWPLPPGSPVPPYVPAFAPAMPWFPTIDGVVLKAAPFEAIKSGAVKTPLLIGTNNDEGTLFVPALKLVSHGKINPMNMSDADFVAALELLYNATSAALIAEQYQPSDYKDNYWRMAAVLRDSTFACSSHRAAAALAEHGVPAYVYHYKYAMQGFPFNLWYDVMGNTHASELAFVWNNFLSNDKDEQMSAYFQTYWTNFAKHHDPNGAGLPKWPTYAAQENIVMDVPPRQETGYLVEACKLWATIQPKQLREMLW